MLCSLLVCCCLLANPAASVSRLEENFKLIKREAAARGSLRNVSKVLYETRDKLLWEELKTNGPSDVLAYQAMKLNLLYDAVAVCSRVSHPHGALKGAYPAVCTTQNGQTLTVQLPLKNKGLHSTDPICLSYYEISSKRMYIATTGLLEYPVPEGEPQSRLVYTKFQNVYHSFANREEMQNFLPEQSRQGKALLAKESPGGWKRTATTKTGTWNVLVIPVEFPDLAGWPITQSAAMDPAKYQAVYGANGDVDRFYEEASDGKLRFTAEVTSLMTAPKSTSYYLTVQYGFLNELLDDVLVQLTNSGKDIYSYDNWIVSTSSITGVSYSGLGHIGYKGLHINGADSAGTASHEIGHNLGRNHAHSQKPYYDYGSRLDVMGAGSGSNPVFGTHGKIGFGWLDETCDVAETGANGNTFRLYRHDHRNAKGHRAVRLGWYWHQRYYWLEYRAEHGWGCSSTCTTPPYPYSATTSQLRKGVVITEERAGYIFTDDSRLVDATPGTDVRSAPEDVTVVQGTPYTLRYDAETAGAEYATVEVVGSGGTSPNEYLDVKVTYIRGACAFSDDGSPPCADRCTHHHLTDPNPQSWTISDLTEFATDITVEQGRTATGISLVAFAVHGTVTTATVTVYNDASGSPGSSIASVDYTVQASTNINIVPSKSDALGLLSLSPGRYWVAVKPKFDTYPVYLKVVQNSVLGTDGVHKDTTGSWQAMTGVDVAMDVAMECSGTANAATAISITQQPPAMVNSGATFPLSVRFVDASGKGVVIPAGMVVDVEIGNNPGSGHLLTQHAITSDGYTKCLTFDIAVDTGGSGYTLEISGDSLTATTTAFEVISTTASATTLAFSGLWTTVGETATVQQNGALGGMTPVKVLVLKSNGAVDVAISGLVITATSPTAGATLQNAAATVTAGVATFNMLSISSCGDVELVFTADATSLLPVAGKQLTTGIITVTPLMAASYEFSTNSLVKFPGQAFNALLNTPVSPIRLTLLDSCGGTDTTTTGVTITATATGGAAMTSSSVSFVNGVAVFDNLIFTSVPGTPATVTFQSTQVSGNLATGVVSVTVSTVSAFSTIFYDPTPVTLPVSVVEDEPFTTTIWLLDDQGHHDTLSPGVTITPEVDAAVASVFTVTAPAVVVSSGTAVLNVTLKRSGAAVCPTTSFDIRFAASASGKPVNGKFVARSFTVVGRKAAGAKRTSATLPTALQGGTGAELPDYTLSLLDSCGEVDTVTTGVEVVVADAANAGLVALGLVCSGSPCFPFTNGVATVRGLHPTTCVTTPLALRYSFVQTENLVYPVLSETVTEQTTVQVVAVPDTRLAFVNDQALSFFTAANQDKTVTGSKVDTVRVQLMDSCGGTSSTSGTHVTVTPDSSAVHLQGATGVTDQNGVAVFPNITFVGCTGLAPTLTFQVTSSAKVTTGHVTLQAIKNEGLVFLPGSFFTIEHKHKTVTLGSVLPEITIGTVDSCDVADTTSPAGTKIKVTSSGGVLEGGVVDMVNGVARLAGLKFTSLPDHDVKLTFTVDPVPLQMPRSVLVSGDVTVAPNVVVASNIRFGTSSHFTEEHLEVDTTLNYPFPPIVINLENSLHVLDTTTSGITITVTSDDLQLSGTTCTIISGICTFSALVVTSCSSTLPLPTIVFTAVGTGEHPVNGHTLHSGGVNVKGATNSALKFGPGSYFTNEKEAHTATKGVPLPEIVLTILDSCGRLQTDAVGSIAATGAGCTLEGDHEAVVGGYARFSSLVMTEATATSTAIVFKYTPVAGGPALLTATTGVVTMQQAPIPSANMKFESTSAITEEGKTLTITHGMSVARVLIQIEDSAHQTSQDSATKVTVDGGALLPTTVRTAVNGIVEFESLVFSTCGDGKLKFTAESTGKPVHGHTLTTGTISVVGRPGESASLHLNESNIEAGYAAVYAVDSCGKTSDISGWGVASTTGVKCTGVHGKCELFSLDTASQQNLTVTAPHMVMDGVVLMLPASNKSKVNTTPVSTPGEDGGTVTVTLVDGGSGDEFPAYYFYIGMGGLFLIIVIPLVLWKRKQAHTVHFGDFVHADPHSYQRTLDGLDQYDRAMLASQKSPPEEGYHKFKTYEADNTELQPNFTL